MPASLPAFARPLWRAALFSLLWPATTALAQPPTDKEFLRALTGVLPDGRSALSIEGRKTTIKDEFDAEGNQRALFGSYDNRVLDGSVIKNYTGGALGTTHVAAKADRERTKFTLRKSLSDDLTLGAVFGRAKTTTKVDFSVSGGAGTEGIQTILTNSTYQYKRVETETREGQLDPQFFARWIVHHALDDRHWTILTPALRIGASPQDDPDSLVDQPIDYGTTAFILGLTHARLLGKSSYVMLGATAARSRGDEVSARSRSETQLITSKSETETLRRRQGNAYEAQIEAGTRPGVTWYFGRLEYTRTNKDRYYSPTSKDVSGLEKGTNTRAMYGWLGASWRPTFQIRGETAPFVLSLQYRRTLSGHNVPLQHHTYLSLSAPLPF